MDIRWWHAALVVAVVVVPVSSFLGLSARILWNDPYFGDPQGEGTPGAWRFFSGVWTGDYTKDESAGWTIVADATFIATTVAALAGAMVLGARFHPVAGALAGVGANWLAYYLSYAGLSGFPSEVVTDPGEGFQFVWDWGWPGLVFCGLASAGVAFELRRRAGMSLWRWGREAGGVPGPRGTPGGGEDEGSPPAQVGVLR